jgi:Leucine-rich repeat (LRR) protein
MTIDALVTILRDFRPDQPFLIEGEEHELVTRVALNALGAISESEASLIERLTSIRGSHSDLISKITQFESLLSNVHEKTKAELESEFGLAGWNGGPNTEEAKIRILNCYLNQKNFLNLSELELSSLPPLPPFVTVFWCFGNQLTNLPALLPPRLTLIECRYNYLTSLPNLPGSLEYLLCTCNQLTSLPNLPDSLRFLDCRDNQIRELPSASDGCSIMSSGNPLSENSLLPLPSPPYPAFAAQASIMKFQIPKGAWEESLWSRVLMNEVRQKHQGEDYSLVREEYKMWGDDRLSSITIKKIDGDEALIFTFDESSGLLASLKDQSGANLSLMALKERDGWNIILNQFANHVLKEKGIQLEETTIKVHPDALKKFPLKILEMLTPSVTNTRYLNDDFMPNPAIDAGGVFRQFISELCKALFIKNGETHPLICVREDGMPDFKDEEAAIYQKFGKILSFVLTSRFSLVTGVYFNPKFYLLLKKAISGLEEYRLAAAVMKECVTQDPKTLKDLNWYEDPSSCVESKAEVIAHLTDILGADLSDESTDEDICREIETCVLYAGIEIAHAISNVLHGMTDFAKERLSLIKDSELSARIQGVLVSAKDLKDAIKIEEDSCLEAKEKRDWIFEKIDENKENPEWLSNFVQFITGQPFLSPFAPPIHLNFLETPNFSAHTCAKTLDVPLNIAAKEDFLFLLDRCIEDPTSFTTG